jgi:DNA (cytosine-5)-methyltransferase 1
MPELHLRLDAKTRAQLAKRARSWNYTLQEFAERTLRHHAEALGKPVFLNGHRNGNAPTGFTFIDLFAGIGGFRLAFERQEGRCVFTSEWDRWSQKTYLENFGDKPEGDIRKIVPKDIPDHDILVAGFPCQPFSIAGVSKRKSLGREHGFKDKAQGTLFFNLLQVIEAKQPPMFLLENVKHLGKHDSGRTWGVIKGALEEAGYAVHAEILDARHWVPQHRERIFIVGMNKRVCGRAATFTFPEPPRRAPKLGSILERNPEPRYTLSDHLWQYLQDYAEKHREKGNGFGFGLCLRNSVARTLSARYHKDGSEILVKGRNGDNPRRLTPRECARLMGFPEDFRIPVSDTQAYRQFGNAVVVPVAEAVAGAVVKALRSVAQR